MRTSILGLVLAAGLSMVVGCGDDGDGGADLAKFVGTWKYTSGTGTTNCGGMSETDQLQDTVTINRGIDSPLVQVSGTCTLKMDVTGMTASARSGQECSVTENGVNVTIKTTAYTFTVNGIVASTSGSATVQASGPGGVANCTYTETGAMMKISQ
ncbi:MAG TPA: hypothetical protein VGF45_19615 [Polyangia bacterium]